MIFFFLIFGKNKHACSIRKYFFLLRLVHFQLIKQRRYIPSPDSVDPHELRKAQRMNFKGGSTVDDIITSFTTLIGTND